MNDQPLTDDELKELLTSIGPGEFPVTAERIRRLVAEVRALRKLSSAILSDKQEEEFLEKFNAGLAAETRRIAGRSKYLTPADDPNK